MIISKRWVTVIILIVTVIVGMWFTEFTKSKKLELENEYYKTRDKILDDRVLQLTRQLERSRHRENNHVRRIDSLNNVSEALVIKLDSTAWALKQIKGRYSKRSESELAKELERRASY